MISMETENKTAIEIHHVESVPDNVKVTNRAQNFFTIQNEKTWTEKYYNFGDSECKQEKQYTYNVTLWRVR